MSPVRILRGLGGNGGTFLARAIAAMDRVVLLSETNPLSANLFSFGLNPVHQLAANYPLLGFEKHDGHMCELGLPRLFGGYIDTVLSQCAARDLTLVIRDYNYADYIGKPFLPHALGHSSLDAALSGRDRREIVLVRHPADQFRSLVAHEELKNVLNFPAFIAGYRALLDRHGAARLVRYEDLYAEFDHQLAAIGDALDVAIDLEWPERLPQMSWMTGHAAGKTSLVPKATRPGADPDFRQSLQMFGDYRLVCAQCRYDP